MLTDEYRYKVLKLVSGNPNLSQRELASELGVSLGRLNYCLKALIEGGLIKACGFRNSRSRQAYAYLLTPTGIEEKTKVTRRFLEYKLEELGALKSEIENLREEAESQL